MTENPWRCLTDSPPYVLDEDKDKVDAFNLTAHQQYVIHLDFVPEPFIGRPTAPVVILGNNPGVKSPELAAYRKKPEFISRMRDNIVHHLADDFPFLYLDPSIIPSNARWWELKLRSLLNEFDRSVLARSILAVEYFPYVSHRYRHGRLSLQSQQYSFSLVRSAIKREAIIVITRGQRRWLEEVTDLKDYPNLVLLKEVQRAPISQGNCKDPAQFPKIIQAIRASLQ